MPVSDMHGYGLWERVDEQLDTEILYSVADGYLKKGGFLLPGQGVVPSGQVLTLDEATGLWIKYDDVTDVNEVQTLTLSGVPASGSIQLVLTTPVNQPVPGQGTGPFTTAAIDGTGGISAAEIQSAIRAIEGFEDVTVTGTGPYVITFLGDYAGTDVPLVTTANNSLETSAPAAITASVAETTKGVKGGQAASAILARAVDTDRSSQAQPGNVYFSGSFKTAALVGMNANAITDLKATVNTQYGFTRIP